MKHVSPQEADKFVNYNVRLSEIEIQLLHLSQKSKLSDQESELVNSLQIEKAQIVNWFEKTSK
jgi:hypothetical protein